VVVIACSAGIFYSAFYLHVFYAGRTLGIVNVAVMFPKAGAD